MQRFKRLISISLLAVLLVVGLFGCYGNMSLTKKVYNWNGSMDSKFMQQALFWILNFVPVYSVASFIDVVFLNTVEFWTGTNPMAMAPGEEMIKYATSGDKTLQFKFSLNKVIVTQISGAEAGSQIELNYNPIDSSWYLSADGKQQKIASLKGDNLSLIQPSGKELSLNLAY